jgi:Tfp pilus assembly protein PilX
MQTYARRHRSRQSQRGVAALAVALTVLIIATLITVGAVQISVGDQKSMANEVRAREAGSIAEAGLERGVMYLRQSNKLIRSRAANGWMNAGGVKWSPCSTATITIPCGNGTSNIYDASWTAYANVQNLTTTGETFSAGSFITHYVAKAATSGAAAPGKGAYYVIGQGQSQDGTGQALIRKAVIFYPFLAHRPDAPLVAAGTIGLSGTITVVANPNGGGTGVPLSSWSGNDTTESGSMQTCQVAEYLGTDSTYTTQTDSSGNTVTLCPACTCPNTAADQLTNKNVEGIDILDVDGGLGANPDSTNFPPDVFQYTFGVPEAQWLTVHDQAQIITDCGTLNASSAGLYWIDGNCAIPSNTTVGSLDAPLILVMKNGTFKMNANSAFFGVLFAFAQGAGGTVGVSLTGGPTLYGSMISNRDINIGNGTFTARYDKTVLDNLANGGPGAASGMAVIPGSWRDY